MELILEYNRMYEKYSKRAYEYLDYQTRFGTSGGRRDTGFELIFIRKYLS